MSATIASCILWVLFALSDRENLVSFTTSLVEAEILFYKVLSGNLRKVC